MSVLIVVVLLVAAPVLLCVLVAGADQRAHDQKQRAADEEADWRISLLLFEQAPVVDAARIMPTLKAREQVRR